MVQFAFGVLYLAMNSMNANTDNSQSAAAVTRSNTPERMPTPRPFTLEPDSSSPRTTSLSERTKTMTALLESGEPLTDEELDDVINSVQNIVPVDSPIQFDELRAILQEIAHLSHKDWHITGKNSEELAKRLLQNKGIDSEHGRQILERILMEGNWDAAAKYAETRPTDVKPWAVLVTGVNGIRKTTSMYQTWFPQLLAEALVPPRDQTEVPKFPLNTLPVGSNSFFRQLDHMIATLCNEDFKELYRLTEKELSNHKRSMTSDIPPEVIKKYSDLKAAIFGRYRTLSELLGALLLREAQSVHLNCLMETSGRDVAMFHYVDHFFDGVSYNKLALHFTIDDLTQAKLSVDRRMVSEIQAGIEALKKKDAFEIIYANEGGPYGSNVLAGVQEASDKVWNDVVLMGDEVGQDWYKATIAIIAHDTKAWTARAVRPDGSLGTEFTFAPKK